MSAEQIEYAFVVAGGVFGMLVGYGKIDVGLPPRNRAMLRWSAPLVVIIMGGLLIATFFQ